MENENVDSAQLKRLYERLQELAAKWKGIRAKRANKGGETQKVSDLLAIFTKKIAPKLNKNIALNYKERDFIDHFFKPAAESFLHEFETLPDSDKNNLRELHDNAKKSMELLAQKYTDGLSPYETPEITAEAAKQAAIRKERFDAAKAYIQSSIDEYTKSITEYRREKKIYEKEVAQRKKDGRDISDLVPPIDPDRTLIEGIFLADILQELSAIFEMPTTKGKSNINGSNLNALGYYCGQSAALNVVINYNPEGYVRAVIELATVGETQFFPETPVIKLPKYLDNTTKQGLSELTKNAFAADIIFGGALRVNNNTKLANAFNKRALKGEEDMLTNLAVGTFPNEIDNLLRDCGIDVTQQSYYTGQTNKDLDAIEKAVAEGKMPIIFENHLITKADKDKGIWGITGVHFITLHKFQIKGDNVIFSYWHYGAVQAPLTMPRERFLKGMKGYWIPEAPSDVETNFKPKSDGIF